MSLLIDALRKAEAAREKAVSSGDTADEVREAMRLEPIDLELADLPPAIPRAPSPTIPPSPPNRTGHGEPPAQSPSTSKAEAAGAENARQLFAAKPADAPSLTLWVLGIGCGLAILGGIYVWWQTRPMPLGVAAGIDAASRQTAANPGNAAPPRAAQTAPTETKRPPPADGTPDEEDEAPPPPPRVAGAARAPQASDAAPGNDSGIESLHRGAPRAGSPAEVAIEAAYAAYEKGDWVLARARYKEALRNDPRSGDALNGMGAIAMREGELEEAHRWFEKSQALNPRDPVARAGLVATAREPDPATAENQLRSAINEAPENAAAHVALGNLYARGQRWGDAQQAYFKAYTLEPDNPDTLFNLAVALDQLGQRPLARDFYTRALAAGTHRAAGFDRIAATRRIEALSAP